jgi:hypothetical protein
MKDRAIISRGEALQILKNDLCKAALEKCAAELAKATAEGRQKMLAQIDWDIEKELRRRMRRVEPDSLMFSILDLAPIVERGTAAAAARSCPSC